MRTAPPREAVDVAVVQVEEEARRKQDPDRCPRKSERGARRMVLASSVGSQDIAPPSAEVRLIPILLLTRTPPQGQARPPGHNQREAADAATIEDPSMVVMPALGARQSTLSTRMTTTNRRPSCQKTSR